MSTLVMNKSNSVEEALTLVGNVMHCDVACETFCKLFDVRMFSNLYFTVESSSILIFKSPPSINYNRFH